jgi:hypothetical protein
MPSSDGSAIDPSGCGHPTLRDLLKDRAAQADAIQREQEAQPAALPHDAGGRPANRRDEDR